MITFLYGSDTYRSREELKKIIEENKKNNPDWFDFVRIDASDNQIEIFKELKQTTDTISMFSSKKLIIIENVFDLNQESQEEILELLKKKKIENDKDTMIIFWAEKIEAKNEFFKYLKSKAECKEFKSLKETELRAWIKNYISRQGGKIDARALDKVIDYVGNDLWRMSNELNKLLAHDKTICPEDVELLIKPEIDLNIFEMVDAIGCKNRAKAINLLNQHLEKGSDEGYLLSMIAYQIRNLIKIKTAKAIELLGLHPFVATKTGQQAKNFTINELKKIYYRLTTIDFEAKIGKTDVLTALELFLSVL